MPSSSIWQSVGLCFQGATRPAVAPLDALYFPRAVEFGIESNRLHN